MIVRCPRYSMPLLHRKCQQLLLVFILHGRISYRARPHNVCISSTGTLSITLNMSSQYAVEGAPYTLICSVPDKAVSFRFQRAAFFIGAVQVSGSGDCYNVAASKPIVCNPAVCSCVNDGSGKGSEFSWTFTTDSSMNQSTWYCLDYYQSKYCPKFILQFSVPVTRVSLKNLHTSETDLTVIDGTTTNLVCVTNACRPPANVEWYINGRNFTSSSTQTVRDEASNLHITASTLTFSPESGMNGERINCSANNIDSAVTASLLNLNVQYPSDNKVAMNVTSIFIKEGQRVNIMCEVKGGNPKAQIAWNCFGGTTTDVSTGTDSRSVITVVGSHRQDGQPCICRGQHNLVNIAQTQVTFNVGRTTECNNAAPNTASVALFVLSILVLGVAVTFGVVFYIRYSKQVNTESKERTHQGYSKLENPEREVAKSNGV